MAVVKHFPYQHRTSGDLTQQRRALNLTSFIPHQLPGATAGALAERLLPEQVVKSSLNSSHLDCPEEPNP